MEKTIAIETGLGVLWGRDCIFLDCVQQDKRGNLTFSGEINSNCTSVGKKCPQEKKWLPYTLTFQDVLACFSCELDTYGNLAGFPDSESSDFDLIEDSEWLESLPVRNDFQKNRYTHYRIFTYDIVYNIIAGSYKLEISS